MTTFPGESALKAFSFSILSFDLSGLNGLPLARLVQLKDHPEGRDLFTDTACSFAGMQWKQFLILILYTMACVARDSWWQRCATSGLVCKKTNHGYDPYAIRAFELEGSNCIGKWSNVKRIYPIHHRIWGSKKIGKQATTFYSMLRRSN